MKAFIVLLIILYSCHAQSQATYKSNMSEHWFTETGEPQKEAIRRELLIGKDTITIISYGKGETDIQRWITGKRMHVQNTDGNLEVITTHLASGAANDYPAIFTIYYEAINVDFITCLIPSSAHNSLPENAPILTKFYVIQSDRTE